jgi:hypothetical protein
MKLIKTEDEQGVMYSLSGDNLPENYVLSKQNCDELFGVVDVEKLAEEFLEKHKFASSHIADITSFKYGFNKAMALNKDKLFTLEDMKKAYFKGDYDALYDGAYSEKENEFIQSLQKPTEIEVDIVTESKLIGQCNCPCHTKKGIRHIKACCNPKRIEQPKLDSEGCLILKRVI